MAAFLAFIHTVVCLISMHGPNLNLILIYFTFYYTPPLFLFFYYYNNNNLLIGCSITRVVYIEVLLVDVYYMMQLKYKKFKLKSKYMIQLKYEKFKLKSKYKNNDNKHTTRIKNKYLIIKSRKKALVSLTIKAGDFYLGTI